MKTYPLLLLFFALFHTSMRAEGEYEWRYFTKVRNSQKGVELPKTVTAEIKIVSRIDANRFKAIQRPKADSEEAPKPFVLNAADFSPDDQEFLKNWDPNLAIDLSSYPIKLILERSGYQIVPLPHKGTKFEVHAQINGKEACFILDTGAETTVLSLEAAERLGIANGTQIGQAAGISGVPTALFETKVSTLTLNGIETGERSVRYSQMAMKGYDGLFGFDIINRLQGIIDYRDGNLYIKPKGS